MNGTEVLFPFLTRRRCTLSTAKAISKADGMYCLYTAWRALRSVYAARVSRARDRMSCRRAIRIDSFTRRRNSARSQPRPESSDVTGKTRARWASTFLWYGGGQRQGIWGRCPNVKIRIGEEGEMALWCLPSFINRLVTEPAGDK